MPGGTKDIVGDGVTCQARDKNGGDRPFSSLPPIIRLMSAVRYPNCCRLEDLGLGGSQPPAGGHLYRVTDRPRSKAFSSGRQEALSTDVISVLSGICQSIHDIHPQYASPWAPLYPPTASMQCIVSWLVYSGE